MSVEENKAVVGRMIAQGMVERDIGAAVSAYAPDFTYHNPVLREMPPAGGVEAMRGLLGATHSAFPDLRHRTVAMVAEGDLVAVLYTWHGTHTGSLGGIPATGRAVTATGAIVCRLEGGRIVEQWDIDDRLDVAQQLGLVPPPGGAEPAPPG